MNIFKQKLLSSGVIFFLMGFGSASQAQDDSIDPISHEAIVGDYGLFIDLETDNFLLHQEEWYTIQAYIEEALRLPITKASMISAFVIPEDVSFSTFEALLEQYVEVNETADNWSSNLYPEMVSLALELANYADVHTTFITPLVSALDKIVDYGDVMSENYNPVAAEQHRQTAIALLDILNTYASARGDAVDTVAVDLNTFASDLVEQGAQLEVLLGTHAEYLLDDGSELKVRIAEMKARISALNAEFDRLVTIAATTPTYAWVFPFGTMAGGAVAGIYGARAAEVGDQINQLKDDLSDLKEELTYKENIYISYNQAYDSVVGIEGKIKDADENVQKLRLHWQTMNIQFESIIDALDSAGGTNGLNNILPYVAGLLTDLHLATIQDNWSVISTMATEFSQNAYIVVEE